MSVRKTLKRIGITSAAILCLAFVLFALPVPVWRTGRLPAPPLPVVENGPTVETFNRIWIDTDAACGLERSADPDDCLALTLLARAPDIKIEGISTVFGNADLDDTDQIVRTLAAKLRSDGEQVPAILRGAQAPEVASMQAQLRRNWEYGYAANVVIVACGLIATALARMALCKMRLRYLYRLLMSRH